MTLLVRQPSEYFGAPDNRGTMAVMIKFVIVQIITDPTVFVSELSPTKLEQLWMDSDEIWCVASVWHKDDVVTWIWIFWCLAVMCIVSTCQLKLALLFLWDAQLKVCCIYVYLVTHFVLIYIYIFLISLSVCNSRLINWWPIEPHSDVTHLWGWNQTLLFLWSYWHVVCVDYLLGFLICNCFCWWW